MKERGSSILAGIVFVTMFGSAASAVESLVPFHSDEAQLAAAAAAVQTVSPVKDVVVKDEIPPSQDLKVRYACWQQGDAAEVKALTQKCQPGFLYTISESKGGIIVSPFPLGACASNTPLSAKKCSDTNINTKTNEPIASCSVGAPKPCQVQYCVDVLTADKTYVHKCKPAGEVPAEQELGVGDKRIAGLAEVLKSEDSGSQTEILNNTAGLSTAEQDALSMALTGSGLADAPAEIQSERDDVAGRIKYLATCPDSACGAEKVALADRDAELARQQALLQNLRALGGGQGLSPDERAVPKPSEPAYTPDTVVGDTTFGGAVAPATLVVNPEQASAKGWFGNTVGGLKKGVNAVGSAVSNLADRGREMYENLFSGNASKVSEPPSPYDQTRANDATTARLNGLAAQTLYTGLQKNPNQEIRKAADDIVAATDNAGQQASFLSTLAETTKSSPIIPDALNNPAGLGALSALDKQKLGIQEAIIETPQCAPGSKSILDCFKAADLPYTLKGRTEVANALGLDCGAIGSASANTCMFGEVQRFNQEGTLTNTSINRVVTIDTNGKILSDTVEPHTSTHVIKAPSLAAGGTQEQIDKYKEDLEKRGIVETGDTVYKVNIPAQDVTVKCIDSFGGTVSNPACNATYKEAVKGVELTSKSLPGLLTQIQDTNKDSATTKYVLADQRVVGEERGNLEWVADGGAGTYNSALLQRKIDAVTDAEGNADLRKIAVPYEQLPASVRKQFVPTSGTEAPATAQADVSVGPVPAAKPVESSAVRPPYNQAQVDKATTDRLTGLAESIQASERQELADMVDSALLAREAERQARANDAASARLQGLADYAAAQAERQARADAATSERLYAQANSYVLKNIDDALLASGQYSPAVASEYSRKLMTLVEEQTDTQADAYKLMKYNYGKIVADGATSIEARLIEYGKGQLAGVPSPLVSSDIQLASQPPAEESEPLSWWQSAVKPVADFTSDVLGKDSVILGVQGEQTPPTLDSGGNLVIDLDDTYSAVLKPDNPRSEDLARILRERAAQGTTMYRTPYATPSNYYDGPSGVPTLESEPFVDFPVSQSGNTSGGLTQQAIQDSFNRNNPSSASLASLPNVPARLLPDAPPMPTLQNVDRTATIDKAAALYGADSPTVQRIEAVLGDASVSDFGTLEARLSAYKVEPVINSEFVNRDWSIPVPSGRVAEQSGLGCSFVFFTKDCGLMNTIPVEGRRVEFTGAANQTKYAYDGWFARNTGAVDQNLLPTGASLVTITRETGGAVKAVVSGNSSMRGSYTIPAGQSATYAQILAGLKGQDLTVANIR